MNNSVKTDVSGRQTANRRLPVVGITMGDAAGIGPEITLKAVADAALSEICAPVIIGDARVLRETARACGLPDDFAVIEPGAGIPANEDRIVVYDLANINEEFVIGEDSGVTGRASAEYIETAVELCRKQQIGAIATAPISKKAIHLGGYDYPGHTEMLGALTGTTDFRMSFFAGTLRVVLLSTHVSLVEAIRLVKREKLVELIVFTNRELSKLLNKKVKIAVAGLNPHASEGGMFGAEEAAEINPAIEECRRRFGIDVTGAYSPDTIFLRGFRGEFDAVIACYHDQATIAVKSLSFGESVNVTLGLPIIRTSVDHGTAFDRAGRNIAESSSMKAAVRLAAKLAANSSNE